MRDTATLDLQEQIARIRRMRVETDNFAAEQHKLAEEASKFRGERWMAPVGAIGGEAGLIAGRVTTAKALGWIP